MTDKMGVAYAVERAVEIAHPYDRLVAAAERLLARIEDDSAVTEGEWWLEQRTDLAAALTEIRGD